MKVIDIEHYIFGANGSYGSCRLRIYHFNGRTIVIATAPHTALGAPNHLPGLALTITNGMVDIANRVEWELGIEFDVMIEHYPPRGTYGKRYGEEFALVAFQENVPSVRQRYFDADWGFISRRDVEEMIGQSLD
jgi:hypothetical protein